MSEALGNQVDLVRVSDATREMARPPEYHLKIWREQLQSAINEKRDIELKLLDYSEAKLNKRQSQIREEYRGRPSQESMVAWNDEKCRLQDERSALIRRKMTVERHITELKPKVQRIVDDLTRNHHQENQLKMLSVLVSISNKLDVLIEIGKRC